MTIEFCNNTIPLKYSFRALMIYENITQKSFNPKGLSDVITFFYSVVVASAKDTSISFDSFLDWLDDNPQAINEFSQWLTDEYNHQQEITNQDIKVDKKEEEETEKN